MIKIETQGISEDYREATGDFEPIDRGEVSPENLKTLLEKVAVLEIPSGEEDSPPSLNAMLPDACFVGDSGVIRCPDSKEEEMTPEIALKIITGELTLKEYDLSNGHKVSSSPLFSFIAIGMLTFIAVVIFVIGS